MRNKSITAIEHDIEEKAKAILADFKEFTTGVRFLSLLHRSKDGGHNKEYHRRGGFYVCHSTEDYLDALIRLLILKEVSSKPYRLYASVNARSLAKAEKQFKMEMLEADFSSEDNKHFFYERLESGWVGALMKPGSRTGSLFMIDIDGEGDVTAEPLKWLAAHDIQPIKQYKTPNGWHIITPPFNPTEYPKELGEVKKDGLILLDY